MDKVSSTDFSSISVLFFEALNIGNESNLVKVPGATIVDRSIRVPDTIRDEYAERAVSL